MPHITQPIVIALLFLSECLSGRLAKAAKGDSDGFKTRSARNDRVSIITAVCVVACMHVYGCEV